VLAANSSWTATANDSWLHLSAANQSGTNSANVIFTFDANAGTTRTGTLTIAGQTLTVTQAGSTYVATTDNGELAFVDPTAKIEPASGGSDVLPVVLPITANLTGPFAPASDSPWLTITGVTNGVVSFAFAANTSATNRMANLTVLGQAIPITQMAATYSLGTTNLLEGPTASSDSVVLAANSAWTATVNDSWLHLSAANQSGTNSANVIFTFDANAGATRTGTLTIAGQTLTVTQAGATYVAVTNITTLVSSGLSFPYGVAVDGRGNVYIADSGNNAIKEWITASNTVITLVSSGLNNPSGVAVDGAGNVYIADTWNFAIKEWVKASNNVITLVSAGLYYPNGVAVDGAGNVFIADSLHNAIKELTVVNSSIKTLVSSGLNVPEGVAVDGAGNVYIADSGNWAIKEWSAVSNTVITLVSSGLYLPGGLAVDGSGNVYIADTDNYLIKEWMAASNTIITLVPRALGLFSPYGVAVDSAGNIYIADTYYNAIRELPHAFADTTPKTEPASGGSDSLPAVLPTTANLTGPFVPTNDSPWLTITGVTNGVVSFAFSANSSPTNRTAKITVLGMTVAVTQSAAPVLTGVSLLTNGSFQFGFSNNPGASFTVWTTTNLMLPLMNWTPLGAPDNLGSGQYQFTDPSATNDVQRFYRVTSP
jgi:DNA-binding beta-propeller fold protein YncE